MKNLSNLLTKLAATGLGTGYFPFAPGTFGTLIAVPLCILLKRGGVPFYFVGSVVFTLFALGICRYAEKVFEKHDDRRIVIDEISGYLVTMTGIPPDIFYYIAGFIAFRFFDILKPFPIGIIDRKWRGGIGVMADDLAAGVYACATLWIIFWVRRFCEG